MIAQGARRLLSTSATAAAGVLVLAGCSGIFESTDAAAGSKPVTVKASDAACDVDRTQLSAGPNVLAITNSGAKVTEVYVYTPDGRIVTERENIGPGLAVNLTFEVAAGDYVISCRPGQTGTGIRQKITVTGAGGTTVTQDERLGAAVESYRTYVQQQADAGLPLVRTFVSAVKAGDLAGAAAAYAPSRAPWERVEPVAESFGDLDPAMDVREVDLEPGQEWTGWHRLEKAVFTTKSVAGQAPFADRLLKDYTAFQAKVATATITPTSMANGAKELLDEVATGKITGEEDVWSGTDLYDFAANVEGARKVYDLLAAVVGDHDPGLRAELETAFAGVEAALGKHRTASGFVGYATVTDTERKALAAAVDALAEPLSHLAAALTAPAGASPGSTPAATSS
jgi:iron uptake system component EfeO